MVFELVGFDETANTVELSIYVIKNDLSSLCAKVCHDVLGLLMTGDEEGRLLAVDLIEDYLERAPRSQAALEEATALQDWATCAQVAHEFVSTNGTVGALRFAKLLRSIERACRSDQQERVAGLVGEARSELMLAVTALEGMRSGAGRVHDAAQTLATEVSAEAIVDMKRGEHQHAASTKVVKAVDEMLGDLIDTLA